MNFCKVGKSEVAMLKAVLALLQWCCKQCPKETEVLFHMGLSKHCSSGWHPPLLSWGCSNSCPRRKAESSYCITDSKLLQLLMQVVSVSASTGYTAFILRNHQIYHSRKYPGNRPFLPAVSAGALAHTKHCSALDTPLLKHPLIPTENRTFSETPA